MMQFKWFQGMFWMNFIDKPLLLVRCRVLMEEQKAPCLDWQTPVELETKSVLQPEYKGQDTFAKQGRTLCRATRGGSRGRTVGRPYSNYVWDLMRWSYLVKLRLLQVIPLELRVQVGQSLHTKVVKVGKLLHLIQENYHLASNQFKL